MDRVIEREAAGRARACVPLTIGLGAAPRQGRQTRPLLIGAGRELNASPRNEPVPAHLDVQSWCNAGLLQRVFHWLGAKLCGAFNAGAVPWEPTAGGGMWQRHSSGHPFWCPPLDLFSYRVSETASTIILSRETGEKKTKETEHNNLYLYLPRSF